MKTIQAIRDQVLIEKHGVNKYNDWDDFIDDATLTEILELNDKAWEEYCEHAYSIDKWISVKDQLPEYMQTVLIYDIIGFVTMAQYTGERDVFIAGDCCSQASHWQLLPESPKLNPDN